MPTTPPILVIADDLSGAADCAIAWAGLGPVVALEAGTGEPAEVLAVDTDSRRLSPAAAAAVTRAAVALHAGPVCRLLYKKIDSTLRGQPAAEIAAAGEGRFCLLAPAFPAARRTTEGGRVRVDGTPLEATPLWRREGGGRDPGLAGMLAAEGLPVALASLGVVRGDLAGWLAAQAAAGSRGALCDAVTEADLAAIVAAGRAFAGPLLWAGSAGLARHLGAGGVAPVVARRRAGPVLVVVGSLAEASRAQLRTLAAEPGTACLEFEALDAARLDAALAVPGQRVLAVTTRAGPGADPAEGGAALAAALARLLAPRLGTAIAGLVATGGETARALLAAAGIPALRLAGEVEPGVPLGIALGQGPARGLAVVTKAGAFGGARTLLGCVAALDALPLAGTGEDP